jgi:hypothetical protein
MLTICRKRHCERLWCTVTHRLLKFMCWRRNSGLACIVYLQPEQDKLPFYGLYVLAAARHGALTSETPQRGSRLPWRKVP